MCHVTARISAMLIAAFISIGATLVVALITGGDVLTMLDGAVSAAFAALVNQITHGLTMSTEVPQE